MKIHMEDSRAGEKETNGVPLRKVGVLSNGGQATFEIGNEATRVYVIADSLSKNYCNDCYVVSPGSEDVYTEGENHFDPVGGNPFIFDGNKNSEAQQNRKKNKRAGWLVFGITVALRFVAGFLRANNLF